MKIKCEYTKTVPIGDLKAHPKNPQKHTEAQIERLAKLIKEHGLRHPIIVSKRSGYIVAGHARLEALRKLKETNIPVDFQTFENDDMEYAFLVSDNAIQDWADLDLSMINAELENLSGQDFDIELLGLKYFEVEPADKKKKEPTQLQCPHCGEFFEN